MIHHLGFRQASVSDIGAVVRGDFRRGDATAVRADDLKRIPIFRPFGAADFLINAADFGGLKQDFMNRVVEFSRSVNVAHAVELGTNAQLGEDTEKLRDEMLRHVAGLGAGWRRHIAQWRRRDISQTHRPGHREFRRPDRSHRRQRDSAPARPWPAACGRSRHGSAVRATRPICARPEGVFESLIVTAPVRPSTNLSHQNIGQLSKHRPRVAARRIALRLLRYHHMLKKVGTQQPRLMPEVADLVPRTSPPRRGGPCGTSPPDRRAAGRSRKSWPRPESRPRPRRSRFQGSSLPRRTASSRCD